MSDGEERPSIDQSEPSITEGETVERQARWRSWWRRFRSGWLLEESVAIIKIAVPMVANLFFYQVMFTIALVFVGNTSGRSLELDAAALALSYMNVTGVSVGIGLSSAAETLCAQMYGFKNYKGLGVVTQRGIWILGLAMFPVMIVWLNTESLLLFIQQDPCVSRLTARYVQVYAAALPPFFLYIMLQRYLVAQSIVLLFILVGVVNNVVNVVLHGIFIHWAGIVIRGSALSLVLATLTSPCLVLIYIRFKKLPHQTWGGWSLDGLRKWGQFLRLGIPGLLMICFEWWCFEIAAFVTGSIDKTQLAIHTIILQIISLNFMLPYGTSMGLTVRVGNELGAGNPQRAKRATYAAFVLTVIQSLLIAVFLAGTRTVLGRVFTTDRAVIDGVSQVILVTIPLIFSDSAQGMLQGLLRGAGKQLSGAIVNFVSYYLIGLPLGTFLALWVGMGTLGMWIGLLVASVLQVTCWLVMVATLNWEKESLRAIERAKKGSPSDSVPESASELGSNGFLEEGGGMREGDIELLVFRPSSDEAKKSSVTSKSMIEEVPLMSSADEDENEEEEEEEEISAVRTDPSSRTTSRVQIQIQRTKNWWRSRVSGYRWLIISRLSLLLVAVVLLVLGGIASCYQPHRPLTDYCDCMDTATTTLLPNGTTTNLCETKNETDSGGSSAAWITSFATATTTTIHPTSVVYSNRFYLTPTIHPTSVVYSNKFYLTPTSLISSQTNQPFS